jgi:hypothetical protein
MAAPAAPAERVLSLAAYAHRSHGPITLDDIADNVPGYGSEPPRAGPLEPPSAEWERVRKLVGRDVSDLHEHWGIHLAYDDAEHTYELRQLRQCCRRRARTELSGRRCSGSARFRVSDEASKKDADAHRGVGQP